MNQDTTQDVVQESERAKLINKAIAEYDLDFFSKYSFSGENAALLAQKSLEGFIEETIQDSDQANLLFLSMIEQAYPLNKLIPNIELLLFKIFVSPKTTKELRKDSNNLLAGNLFD